MSLEGYFAFINLQNNIWSNNDCGNAGGVLQLLGMEKDSQIFNNSIISNTNCKFGTEVRS